MGHGKGNISLPLNLVFDLLFARIFKPSTSYADLITLLLSTLKGYCDVFNVLSLANNSGILCFIIFY